MNTLYTSSLYNVASPLDQFEVKALIGLDAPVIGFNFSLTNLGFYAVLVLFLFIGLQVYAASYNSPGVTLLVPSR